MQQTVPNDFLSLSIQERILLVEDLWDSITLEQNSVPITEKQKEELDHRIKTYENNPSAGTDWQTVKKRILQRYNEL